VRNLSRMALPVSDPVTFTAEGVVSISYSALVTQPLSLTSPIGVFLFDL
jgi:hypothetical protein